MDKRELRQHMRRIKQAHSQQQLADASVLVCSKLHADPLVSDADIIILYWALPDEVCTHDLVRQLASEGKTVLLPRVISDTEMTLHQYTSPDDLSVGAYGIMEPTGEPYPIEKIHHNHAQGKKIIAVIPGMAFDKSGHRLGRGKGYYDRMLSRIPYIYTIGMCFPFQVVEEVPCESYDITMQKLCF